MKRNILLALIVFTVSVFAQTQQTQQTTLRIGYVDSEVILAQFPEAIKAKGDLEKFASNWKKDLDSMQTDYQKSQASMQKEMDALKTEKEKKDFAEKAQQKLDEKARNYTQYNQSKFGQPNGEYYVKQQQLMAPVKEKIFKAIDEVSKEENMQFVFDKAGDVILLKADPQYDITYKVLDLLKRGKK